jgi:hypothetical protein
VGADTLDIFNIQGRGYANDNGIVRLVRDHGVEYEIGESEIPATSQD